MLLYSKAIMGACASFFYVLYFSTSLARLMIKPIIIIGFKGSQLTALYGFNYPLFSTIFSLPLSDKRVANILGE